MAAAGEVQDVDAPGPAFLADLDEVLLRPWNQVAIM